MTLPDLRYHLEHLTACPITHQPLRWLEEGDLASVNARIARHELCHFDTTPAEKPLEAGLITADGAVVYPIVQDIALLLPDFALVLGRLEGVQVPDYQPSVRDFYDTVGWSPSGDGYYEDAHRYEDLRPVAHDYVYDCHLRVNDYLPAQGIYLLDVASGPIQYPTYLTYSEHFEIRVCVDISFRALVDARQRVPAGRGLFILGNIRNLPFQSGVFDAAVSLHTVYHIVAEQQHAVFDELHRVIKPHGRAVVVYTWGNISPLNKLAACLVQAQRAVRRALHRQAPGRFAAVPAEDTFYYHPFPYRWFKQQTWDYKFTILCWRSISVDTSKLLFHGWLGKKLLRIIFRWEARYPEFVAPLGQYPLFLIDKA